MKRFEKLGKDLLPNPRKPIPRRAIAIGYIVEVLNFEGNSAAN